MYLNVIQVKSKQGEIEVIRKTNETERMKLLDEVCVVELHMYRFCYELYGILVSGFKIHSLHKRNPHHHYASFVSVVDTNFTKRVSGRQP